MKRLMVIATALILVLSSCEKAPVADFIYTPDDPVAGEQVFFNNLSFDYDYVEWDFDDGTTTSAVNPVHTFLEGGNYAVTLYAYGRKGKVIDSYTQMISVLSATPVADFGVYTDLPVDGGVVAMETDIVFVGEQVEFYNTSINSNQFVWSLGDGSTTTVESPVYSYDTPGRYTITLSAKSITGMQMNLSKTIEVVEGFNSALRITVLEYNDEYPVEDASVLLYGSVSDWENEINPSDEVFTTPLGKCVFEGLNYQHYYVDVWEADHDNYTLAAESVSFIETQALEPGYIHDFIAYVDYYAPEKKLVMTRIAKKQWAKEEVSTKKATEHRELKINKFTKKQ